MALTMENSPESAKFAELTSKLQDLIQAYGPHTPSSQLGNGQVNGNHYANSNLARVSGTTSRLDGKVAIVTDAGRGIGAGFAQELARQGAAVVINYSSSDEAAQQVVESITATQGHAKAIKADITDVGEIDKLFQDTIAHFGAVDIVVSNAGVENFTPMKEITPEIYDKVFGLNTRAQFFVGQAAWKYCRPFGRVVLMSSIAAGMMGPTDHYLYAGSKSAVEGFVRTMAFDFGKKDITVNAIAPGGVKTDVSEQVESLTRADKVHMFTHAAHRYIPGADKTWGTDQLEEALANACPLGRVAYPVDIGRVVEFLASEDGGWVNGQTILLSGGSMQ